MANTRFALSILALLTCNLPSFAQTPSPVNLVMNGDFSKVTRGIPDGWECSGNAQRVEQKLEAAQDGGFSCAKLTCTRFQGGFPDSHAMIAQKGVCLFEGKTYEFRCRARADGIVGKSASVAISDTVQWSNCGLDQSMALSSQWREYRFMFTATRTISTASRLQIWFGETGVLNLADVHLEQIVPEQVRFTHTASPADGRNLTPNGDFSLGSCGWSTYGTPAGWGNVAMLRGSVLTASTEPRFSYLRIPIGDNTNDPLYFDYLRPTKQVQTRSLTASMGWIPVEVGADYTVSCSMRASVDDVPALVGVMTANPAEGWVNGPQGASVSLTRDWKRYSWTFRCYKPYVYVVAGPQLTAPQQVSVDITNIQLERGDTLTDYAPHRRYEAVLAPNAPGGIFTVGSKPGFTVYSANHTAEPINDKITFAITDYYDKAVNLPPLTVKLPPYGAAKQVVNLPASALGYLRVKATSKRAGSVGDLRVAVTPKRTSDDTVLGINHAFPDNRLIDLAKLAGVTWYRDWSLKWQDIEPQPDTWTWAATDPQIDRVAKRNARLVALMPPFPAAAWASEAPDGLPTQGYPAERLREAWAPKRSEQMAEFIGKTVERYKDRIRVWEFLNEPLYTDYALPGPGKTNFGGITYGPKDYVNLLRTASTAIRKADPAGRIIGGIASGPDHMTNELMDEGILPLIDIFNLHLYPGTRAPEAYIAEMDRFVKAMKDHGAVKPIWITEFSYYGDDDQTRKPFIASQNNWAEARLLSDERECSDYTLRFLTIMLAHGTQKVFIHSGASGAVNEPNLECCLFTYGGAPRKSMPAMAVYTRLMGAKPRCVYDAPLGADGRAAGFETKDSAVVVVWTTGEPRKLGVGAVATQVLDTVGAVVPPANITVSGSPIYILGPSGKAKQIAKSLLVR